MTDLETCPDCGVVLPAAEGGPLHPYLGSSASCWKLYGEILAREFSDRELFSAIHQVTVDAYAVQHPGRPERRSIQSVAVHLMMLTLLFDRGVDLQAGPSLRRRMTKHPEYVWLEPPHPNGTVTVADVHRAETPDQHREAVWAWARDVWQAWKPHHATVNRWLDRVLEDG